MRRDSSAAALLAFAAACAGCGVPVEQSSSDVVERGGGCEHAFPGRRGLAVRGALLTAPTQPVVVFEVIDGHRILEGDILLDEASVGPAPEPGQAQQPLAAITQPTRLWSGGVVPYVIDAIPGAEDAAAAIAQVNAQTSIQLIPRSTEADYLRFVDGPGCSSYVGRIGGEQPITLNALCGVGAGIHEIGHALGAWHEQQRQDRDAIVTVNHANIQEGYASNFEPYLPAAGQGLTAYDLGSIMHYGSYAFSKNGEPTIVRTSTGEPYEHNRKALSPSDIWGIQALYAAEACGCGPNETCLTTGQCSYFVDVPPDSTHAADIATIYEAGITKGCGPQIYCPNQAVTRAQMASFLTRALGLTPRPGDEFSDVDPTSTHAQDIYAIKDAGITLGCAADKYCPADPVTRAQMASFLVRAMNLESATGSPFKDITDNSHAADIEALWAAGITTGCAADAYCPDASVTRAQMASFLVRALGL